MTRRRLALTLALGLAAAAAAPARAAIGYETFMHPRGDFAVQYPSDWRKSLGLERLSLIPPGRDARTVRMSVTAYPVSKSSPATPAAFIDKLLADAKGLKRVVSRDTVKTSGGEAQRVALVETTRLKGAYDTVLPGPMSELYVVVPDGTRYLVLKLEGVGDAYTRARPEFDRMVSSLKLGGAPAAQRSKR